MSAGDILVIAFFIFFCIDVAGSIVFMFLNYLNRKKELEYVRCIIRRKECEMIEKTEEVKG